jgi:hypothetical protein
MTKIREMKTSSPTPSESTSAGASSVASEMGGSSLESVVVELRTSCFLNFECGCKCGEKQHDGLRVEQ